MLWIKAWHIIFMVTWFAGLFYLPRLYLYHGKAHDELSHERFRRMETGLMVITTIGASLTIFFGLWLLFAYWMDVLGDNSWLHAKLLLVALLIGYHGVLLHIMLRLRKRNYSYSAGFLRWFNELPTLLLIAIVILAVVKPF